MELWRVQQRVKYQQQLCVCTVHATDRGFEWNRGSNVFSVPPSTAGANWSALPSYSNVIVETMRIHLGIGHEFSPAMRGYFRYVQFDYEGLTANYNNGTANSFLAGSRCSVDSVDAHLESLFRRKSPSDKNQVPSGFCVSGLCQKSFFCITWSFKSTKVRLRDNLISASIAGRRLRQHPGQMADSFFLLDPFFAK